MVKLKKNSIQYLLKMFLVRGNYVIGEFILEKQELISVHIMTTDRFNKKRLIPRCRFRIIGSLKLY